MRLGRAAVPLLSFVVLAVVVLVLPSVVADELRRLNPDRVVILGGTSVISSSVAAAIDAIVD